MTWRPLLTGALRSRALSVCLEIGDALRVAPIREPALGDGKAGVSLLFAYLAQAGLRSGDDKTAARLLDEAIDGVAAIPPTPSLYAGFTGVAWTISHLTGTLLASGRHDPNDAIDRALVECLDRSPWRGGYDLLDGLVGIGVYAFERLPKPRAARCLELVIARLEELAIDDGNGLTWSTPPGLPPRAEDDDGTCHYYLGMARGITGVIALLARVAAADTRAKTSARRLLDKAVPWLLSTEQPRRSLFRFPRWIVEPGAVMPAKRASWCFGDPGAAVAMLAAGSYARRRSWQQEGLATARAVARCPIERDGIVDAGLCHGTAGGAHLLNRMFHATGDPTLGRAATRWYARTLSLRRRHGGIAGFSAAPRRPGRTAFEADPGFLRGAAGVGLALLAGATAIEPRWDAVLLASLPVVRRPRSTR